MAPPPRHAVVGEVLPLDDYTLFVPTNENEELLQGERYSRARPLVVCDEAGHKVKGQVLVVKGRALVCKCFCERELSISFRRSKNNPLLGRYKKTEPTNFKSPYRPDRGNGKALLSVRSICEKLDDLIFPGRKGKREAAHGALVITGSTGRQKA